MGGRPLTLENGCYTLGMIHRRTRARRFFCVPGLVEGAINLIKDGSVCDFGASIGCYVKAFREAGLQADGIDGTPGITEYTSGLIHEADLSQRRQFCDVWDWGFSIETGEHLPPEFADTFVSNICRHVRKGIIVSWATPNVHGRWHRNPLTVEQVEELFARHGFVRSHHKTRSVRRFVKDKRLRKRILVLRPRRGRLRESRLK